MRASRKWIVLLGGTAVVAVLSVYLGAAENPPAAGKAPDLAQRVAALEEKVARLEKKLDEQAARSSYVPQPGIGVPYSAPPVAPLAPGAPTPQNLPAVVPNGVPYQFNGQTYYIMPLKKDGTQ